MKTDRFSLEGEAIAKVLDNAWQAIGDTLANEFPSAEYGDLSPEVTAAVDAAIENAALEWIAHNVPTNAIRN